MKSTLIALTLLSVVSAAGFHDADANSIELPTLRAGAVPPSRRASQRRASYGDLGIEELREALTMDSADLAGDLDFLMEQGLRTQSPGSGSGKSNDTDTTGEDRVSGLDATKIHFPEFLLNDMPQDVYDVAEEDHSEEAEGRRVRFAQVHRCFSRAKLLDEIWNGESKQDIIDWLYHVCIQSEIFEELGHDNWGLIDQLEIKMIVTFDNYKKEFMELEKTFKLLSLENERLYKWLSDDKLNDRIKMEDIQKATEEYEGRRHDLKMLAKLAFAIHQKASGLQLIKEIIHGTRIRSRNSTKHAV